MRAKARLESQQASSISGKVTDKASGQPLAGARVQATGTQYVAITNQQGSYSIRSVRPGTYNLRIIMVGYASQQKTVPVSAEQAATVDWVLSPIPFKLEDIVTTVTGEQLKRELGHSVGKIEASQLVETAPIANLSQLLSGRIAGLTVVQNGGTSGQGARIRIRGISSVSLSRDPLLYIDGIRVSGDASGGQAGASWGGGAVSKLNDLNPEEIESIEVVKGPSAATLYGTQAANGIIRVTTKQGRVGTPQWHVWTEAGILSDPVTYPKTYFSKAVSTNPSVFCLPYQQALGQCQIEKLYTLDLLNADSTTPFTTGFRSQLGTSLSGGSEIVRYFLSAETEHETGPLKLPDTEVRYLQKERGIQDLPHDQLRPNHFSKHNFRVNLASSPRSNLDVSLNSGLVFNDILLPQLGNNVMGFIISPSTGSANPAVYAATGGYSSPRPADFTATETFRKSDHFINSAHVDWRPLPWLSAKGTFGLDYLSYVDEQNTLNGQGSATLLISGIGYRQGLRILNRYTQTKYTVDLNGTAQFKLTDRIASRTAVGVQYNHDKLYGVLTTAGVMPPGILSLTAGAIKVLNGEQTTDGITLGTYLEQQFSLDDRLFLTGAFRIDDNSAFGRSTRSAHYPKAAVSWVALEPRDAGLVTSFRLRGAYGASGQSPGPLDALTYLTPVTASVFGGASTPGVTLGGLGDPALKPEHSREIEAGFDAGLLNNRVRLEFTLYDKHTSDALVQRQLPHSIGAVVQRLENVGVVSNRGVEISLYARVIESRNLTWDIETEASGNRNRLVSLAAGVPPILDFGVKNIPGYPLYGIWWPDLLSYSDKNGDGFIDPTEVVVSDTVVYKGSSVPTRTLTANTGVSLWRNRFRVGAQIDYKGGFVSSNFNDAFTCGFSLNCRSLHDPTASLEDQARAIAAPRAFAGAYTQNAEHIRLREVAITYNAPASVARWLRARTMNVTLAGRNLALWKFGFKSWDPENVYGTQEGSYNFMVQAQPVVGVLRINLGF
jgi:TonB-linked SusC/RagA family outer membrane protein